MVSQEELELLLRAMVDRPIELRLNRTARTLMSLRERKGVLHLSLHEMFLSSPPEVVRALAYWARGSRSRETNAILRCFMATQSMEEKRRGAVPLVTQGQVYDLGSVYDAINRDYFDGALDLDITWFGRKSRKRWRTKILGEYIHGLQLVRVHRLLDDKRVPWQYLFFIVYHEMLHHLVRPRIAPSGRVMPHTREFRKREEQFAHYSFVKEWEKSNGYT